MHSKIEKGIKSSNERKDGENFGLQCPHVQGSDWAEDVIPASAPALWSKDRNAEGFLPF